MANEEGEILEPRRRWERRGDVFFGTCPHCLNHDGYLNVNRVHYFKCDEHRTYWIFGDNIFSGWREETEEQWQANIALLETFREVEPIHPRPIPERQRDIDELESLFRPSLPFPFGDAP
jgi:hypothetical protein